MADDANGVAVTTHALGRLLASGRSPRSRLLLGALATVFGVAGLWLPIVSHLPEYIYQKDLVQEYLLARALIAGADPYMSLDALAARYIGDVGVQSFSLAHPTPHPPTVGLIFLPLTLFGYPAFALAVFALKLVAIYLAVWLVGRVPTTRLSPRAALFVALAFCGWYPFGQDLWFGQLGVFILCLTAGARLALLRGRVSLGGGLLGAALLVKPLTWPLLLLFLPRSRWRGLLAAGVVIAAGYAAIAVVAGPAVLVRYFRDVLPLVAADYRAFALNTSLGGVGWRIFSGTHSSVQAWIAAPPLHHDERLAAVVGMALPLAVVVASGWLALRRLRPDAGFALLAAVSAVASPISWGHYLVLALLPIAWAVGWLARHGWPVRATNAALLVALGLLPSPYDWSDVVLGLAGQARPAGGDVLVSFWPSTLTLAPLVAALGLLMLVVALGRREANESACAPCEPGGPAIY